MACVEYARRWLLINQGMVYGDVDYAVDIWDKIDHYKRMSDGKIIPTVNHVNGSATRPQVGDLLIYARAMFNGTGHSAVIIDVNEQQQKIKLAEQNNLNQHWPADYAREIAYIKDNDRYWLLDGYLLGWKRARPD